MIESWAANERDGWERQVAGAWHAAAFARVDKLKPLDEYLPRLRKPVRQQTEREMMANVFTWLNHNDAEHVRQH
jgi:hypothetical protein